MEASTSSPPFPPAKDENRIIVAVTGANGGLGLGYCHRLLRSLSTQPPTSSTSTSLPPTLTLILACRSEPRARKAIQQLFSEHDLGLAGRRIRGHKDRQGWREGLRIVFEPLDVDKVGGEGGVMDFCGRIKKNYPHLTTLVLNAGAAAFTGLEWSHCLLDLLFRPVQALTTTMMLGQDVGRKSSDGERGGVWGVNVLSSYILAQELLPHLSLSPPSLPLSPRIIYISSSTASPLTLPPTPASDLQLLTPADSYGASKYVAELVISHVDYGIASTGSEAEKRVRAVVADPGVLYTDFMKGVVPWVFRLFEYLSFWIARLFLGSKKHTISADKGSISMYYLTTASSTVLEPPRPSYPLKPLSRPSSSSSLLSPSSSYSSTHSASYLPLQPAPGKYLSLTSRWGTAYVVMSRVEGWGKFGELAGAYVEECERVRGDWKKRIGEGKGGVKEVGEGVKENGVEGGAP